jgi:hypothetical protein
MWTPNGDPGNNDTVDTGAYDVTVDANRTIGTSPAATGTDAVTVSSGGSLTLAEDITLTVRGDITATTGTTITMELGSSLILDSTQAADPATADYRIKLGTTNYLNALLKCQGTLAKPCTVKGHASGGGINFDADTISNSVQATYTTFQKLTGGSADGMMLIALDESSGFHSSFTNCIFDDCKEIHVISYTSAATDGEVTFQNCVWKNSPGGYCLNLQVSSGPFTSVLLDGCYFDDSIDLNNVTNYTIQNCVFTELLGASLGTWTLFDSNLMYKITDTRHPMYGDVTNCYGLIEDASATAPRHIDPLVDGMSITGNIFQHTGNNATGGEVVFMNVALDTGGTIANNIVLPNADGSSSGPLMVLRGKAGDAWSINHNTCAHTGVVVGETYAGHAGQVTSYKSNITWHATSGGYHIDDSSGTTQDLVSSANADYNCGWNLTAGSNLKGYNNLDFSSGSPGANDFDDVDPGFVDSTRDLAAWDTALGGAGTIANALAELAKIDNIAGTYDSNYTVAAAVTWVKGGFAPTNVSLENAGHDNVTVGAVEGSFDNSSSSTVAMSTSTSSTSSTVALSTSSTVALSTSTSSCSTAALSTSSTVAMSTSSTVAISTSSSSSSTAALSTSTSSSSTAALSTSTSSVAQLAAATGTRTATGVYQLILTSTIQNVLDTGQTAMVKAANLLHHSVLADGIDDYEINRAIASKNRLITSGNTDDIDLYDWYDVNVGLGGGRDHLGQQAIFEEIVAVVIRHASGAGSLEILGSVPANHATWVPQLTVAKGNALKLGGAITLFQPAADALDIYDASSHKLRLGAVGGSVYYDIYVMGRHDDDASSSSSSSSSTASSASSSSDST